MITTCSHCGGQLERKRYGVVRIVFCNKCKKDIIRKQNAKNNARRNYLKRRDLLRSISWQEWATKIWHK